MPRIDEDPLIIYQFMNADLASAHRVYSRAATIIFAIMALGLKALGLPGRSDLIALIIVGFAAWYAISDRIFQRRRTAVELMLQNFRNDRNQTTQT